MGEVYRATDTNLKRQVAIKVLPEAVAADAERLARFQREAELLASLNHPNIAIIHGLEKSDGVTGLVMELVEGPTLGDRIAQGSIPIDDALPIAKQIAQALEAAHEQGIIHRDLKPANVKLRPDGTVKVLDFGLAKVLDPQPAAIDVSHSPTIASPTMMTGVGVLLGTAAYMSPEQARGKAVDKRADIWAFGAVLYEMLTGKRAFDGEDVTDTLAAVVRSEPKWDALPDAISPTLRLFLFRCLHKDSKQRVGDIRDVRLALEGVFETIAPQVAEVTVASAGGMWRRTVLLVAALMVGGLLVGLTAWSLWPSPASAPVSRFRHTLPSDQVLRGGRSVVALAADGRHFIYGTTGGLYLRSIDDLESRLITGTEGLVSSPFFAPDGESVGYFQNGQLKRIGVNGGTALVICAAADPFGVSWSTDNTILFGQPNGIMRVSASGGTPEVVIPVKQGEQIYGPQLLPDADSVLFSVTTGAGRARWDEAHIVIQSLSTGRQTVVVRGGSDARYVPTGHLLYVVGEGLFALRFDVDRGEVSGAPQSIIGGLQRSGNPTVNGAAANYDVSSSGTLVYLGPGTITNFVSGDGALAPLRTLAWVDRSGREESLAVQPLGYVYPRLSPDGARMAVSIQGRAENGGIWIWDFRRQTMTRFTISMQNETAPVWSPNGRRLAWASQRAGGPLNVYWQASDGSGTIERLTESSINHQRPSSFTPDAQHLLLAEGPPGASSQDLGMVSLSGNPRLTWLVKTTSSELGGEISPDGRWLAYESNESGRYQIYIRPFPAVDQGRWQVSTSGGTEPVWARSGRELFYLALDNSVVSVPVDAPQGSSSPIIGAPAALIAGTGYYTRTANNMGRTYDVSPDGTRFLRVKVTDDGPRSNGALISFVVVENWFEELKRLVPTK
jgi:serine/threonine-protein kinase